MFILKERFINCATWIDTGRDYSAILRLAADNADGTRIYPATNFAYLAMALVNNSHHEMIVTMALGHKGVLIGLGHDGRGCASRQQMLHLLTFHYESK
jgi:hypothetical protein